MEFTAPVSTIMSRDLITVAPGDAMIKVKEIFEKNKIHHIPVVRFTQLVGIISKTDFAHFLRGAYHPYDKVVEESMLQRIKVEEIMTTGIASVESTDRINVALQVFSENLFHAIPVVDDGKLVGIVSTLDIINKLLEEDQARILSN